MPIEIPKEIREISKTLEGAGFEAHLVGGCVRDLLMDREPKDWDVATNASPEEIQKLFADSVYENNFGTVGVKTASKNPGLKVVEVTAYRLEGRYTDKRHPDEVKFAKNIEEDLSRRDFTVNAIAMAISLHENKKTKKQKNNEIVDLFGGEEDIKNKIIRAVGDPDERFNEDALRLLRAVRFAAQLGFKIEEKTKEAVHKNHKLLELISAERIRDEFSKLLMTERAAEGVETLRETGLLKYIAPELLEGVGIGQNKHHIYTVYEHNLRALDYATKKGYSLEVRLASLLHDVGKPRTKRGEGPDCTFYNHEIVGAKMILKIMDRLRFPKDATERVAHLVRWHMFYYNVGEVSEAGVRRFLVRIGPDYLDDILKVREADRIGSGVPKAVPYKMRHLLFMIDKVKRDPVSPKELKIDGADVMKELSIAPGPRIGHLLALLLEEVLDDPKKNDRESLIARLKELNELSDDKLKKLREKAEKKKEEFEAGLEAEMKKKHFVK
jgi:poly(A) polymerase/tRNA nucleotidyltransferase (CCA-adding enzyme)